MQTRAMTTVEIMPALIMKETLINHCQSDDESLLLLNAMICLQQITKPNNKEPFLHLHLHHIFLLISLFTLMIRRYSLAFR